MHAPSCQDKDLGDDACSNGDHRTIWEVHDDADQVVVADGGGADASTATTEGQPRIIV